MEKAIEVLKALKLGKEVEMEGRVLVWLDNHVVSETDTHQRVIDGLAIKSRMYKATEDIFDPNAGEPHYMGFGDISINAFVKMCEDMPEKDMELLRLDSAFTTVMSGMAKKRTLKGE